MCPISIFCDPRWTWTKRCFALHGGTDNIYGHGTYKGRRRYNQSIYSCLGKTGTNWNIIPLLLQVTMVMTNVTIFNPKILSIIFMNDGKENLWSLDQVPCSKFNRPVFLEKAKNILNKSCRPCRDIALIISYIKNYRSITSWFENFFIP